MIDFEQPKEIDAAYFDILEKNAEDFRIFSHGIRYHFESIANMDTIDEVRAYINSIYPDLEILSYTGMSKNKAFDVIINKYTALCSGKGIDISFDVKTLNLSFIEPPDLSIILNNLLDNAVTAAGKSDSKTIRVSCFCRNEKIAALRIINSCDQEPKSQCGNLVSTKYDATIHGFGVKSVERVIRKYNGQMEWKYDKGTSMFEVLIAFPLKSQK